MPDGRPHAPVTPATVAAWESRVYPALAAQHAAATSTPIDDELPERPWNHLVETRAAIAHVRA